MRLAGSRIWSLSLIGTLIVAGTVIPAFGAAKPGSACKKVEQVRVVKGVSLKCTKVGKKRVWRKVASIPVVVPAVEATPSPTPSASPSPAATTTPEPSPTPTVYIVPTSFDNLYENRNGISYAAWKSVSEAIEANADRGVKLEILVGPNTKPHFADYEEVVILLVRAFPKASLPPRTLVIQFSSDDIEWAETQYREKVPLADRSRIDFNERDGFIRGNCPMPTNCNGARQQTTLSGLSIIPHGVATVAIGARPDMRITNGMLEVHEYFHGMQRVQLLNKDLDSVGWPPAWFSEGSAEFMQNSVINRSDYETYRQYAQNNCDAACSSLSEERIVQFLIEAKDWSVPEGLNRWINYSLGSVIVEIFAAVGGHQSIIDFYEAVGTKLTFAQAFEKVYGKPWKDAIPIIAKTIYANVNNQ